MDSVTMEVVVDAEGREHRRDSDVQCPDGGRNGEKDDKDAALCSGLLHSEFGSTVAVAPVARDPSIDAQWHGMDEMHCIAMRYVQVRRRDTGYTIVAARALRHVPESGQVVRRIGPILAIGIAHARAQGATQRFGTFGGDGLRV